MATATKKTDKFTEHATNAAKAREAAEEAVASYVEARDHLDELRGSITAGDETIIPEVLATATAAVELTHLRARGADARAKAAHENAPFEPVIARAVGDILHEAFGIPAHVVEEVPSSPETPAFYVVQPLAAKLPEGMDAFARERAFTGAVELTYSRTDLHRELTKADLEKVLRAYGSPGVHITVTANGARLSGAFTPLLPYSTAELDAKALATMADNVAGYFHGGVGKGGTLVDDSTTGTKRTIELRVRVASDFPGAASDLVHQPTPLGRIVRAEEVDFSLVNQMAPGENAHIVWSGNVATVALTIVSATEPYTNALAPAPYKPLFNRDGVLVDEVDDSRYADTLAALTF